MEYRGYLIVQAGKTMMKEVKPVGKGSVPKELRGFYTTSRFAEIAIDATIGKKEATNGKAK